MKSSIARVFPQSGCPANSVILPAGILPRHSHSSGSGLMSDASVPMSEITSPLLFVPTCTSNSPAGCGCASSVFVGATASRSLFSRSSSASSIADSVWSRQRSPCPMISDLKHPRPHISQGTTTPSSCSPPGRVHPSRMPVRPAFSPYRDLRDSGHGCRHRQHASDFLNLFSAELFSQFLHALLVPDDPVVRLELLRQEAHQVADAGLAVPAVGVARAVLPRGT